MLHWGADPLTLVLDGELSAKVVYGDACYNHFCTWVKGTLHIGEIFGRDSG